MLMVPHLMVPCMGTLLLGSLWVTGRMEELRGERLENDEDIRENLTASNKKGRPGIRNPHNTPGYAPCPPNLKLRYTVIIFSLSNNLFTIL